MGKYTQCNFCSYKAIKKRKEKGMKITKMAGKSPLYGINIYVHPRGLNLKSLYYKEREPYFAAWFMDLTDYCCCWTRK